MEEIEIIEINKDSSTEEVANAVNDNFKALNAKIEDKTEEVGFLDAMHVGATLTLAAGHTAEYAKQQIEIKWQALSNYEGLSIAWDSSYDTMGIRFGGTTNDIISGDILIKKIDGNAIQVHGLQVTSFIPHYNASTHTLYYAAGSEVGSDVSAIDLTPSSYAGWGYISMTDGPETLTSSFYPDMRFYTEDNEEIFIELSEIDGAITGDDETGYTVHLDVIHEECPIAAHMHYNGDEVE